MTNKIWAYIDQFKGEALPSSWETIGAGLALAESLGGGVTAVVMGENVGAIAEQAFQYGADEVLVADDATLGDYRAEAYTALLAKLAADSAPEVILFPTTSRGREVAGMAAVDLNTGVLVDVIALEIVDGAVIATRPVYAGKLLAKVQCNAKPQMVTLRGRAFAKPEADAARTGTPTEVAPALSEEEINVKVVDYATVSGGVSLTDAAVIVSGGRGVSNNPNLEPPGDLDEAGQEVWRAQQGFKLVGDLAEVLGAAVGASRAAVDAGYIPYVNQVGQTGKVVAPDLYVACGISGAIQHLAGMRTSKVIVAINKDPDAPIFKLARFGVVGDLFEILPPLAAAMKERLGQ
ncbi:MAG: electron transfer flavoprotein subunit alpha/FixB family protein [Chloroflexi bacterium]|mgnify:CR=1 FL=1|jgi:electron transfer flavoprotein alpha subunit|nr:electron transfer flavoprotein subunit alpha/FixB family protein [Chloroflexota bacterium]